MSTLNTDAFSGRRVLIIGVGGLGCPAAWALARSGVTLCLLDDDVVDESNLHRQILFQDSDVGEPKLLAARRALLELGCCPERIELHETRFLPDNALELAASVDVVIEGADNYATKFLAADACHLAAKPIVHGAGVGLRATVWAVSPRGLPCYRCLFEDLPETDGPNCNSAGVLGPCVGFAGALLAELALEVLAGQSPYGVLFSYDGVRDQLRRVGVSPRPSCPLCGSQPAEAGRIEKIEEERYTRQVCAA